MKKWFSLSTALALALFSFSQVAADAAKAPATTSSSKVGVVMIRACFDQSKAGHNARDTLENMNKQMTAALEEIDRQIEEISSQLDDENNRDSMTPEAEKQLQDKFESLSQERELKRMQFSQQMNQSQMMIMQKIYDHVTRASEKVAKEMDLDLIVQEDSTLYFAAGLDVTKPVLQAMDKLSEEEAAAVEAAKETMKK